MAKIDLSQFSFPELQELSQDIDTELQKRRVEERKRVAGEMKGLAASIGMTVEEILGLEMARKTKTKSQAPAKYQNPDNPEQTWSGRGKKPNWLKEKLGQGRSLEEFEIR